MSNVKVSELGEFGLIDLLAKMADRTQDKETAARQQLIIGIGDDAAAWYGDASIQLATVDSLIQDVHFLLDIVPWEDLGWKAMAVNLSDIAAMGGSPLYALVTLGLKPETEVEDVHALYRGMLSACQEYKCRIVGGDMVRSPVTFISP